MNTFNRRFCNKGELRTQRADGRQYLTGYAALYDSLSGDLGGWYERIIPGAFARAIREHQDVRHLINHDPTKVLGRTKSATTILTDDAKGLRYFTELPEKVSYAQDLLESVRRGDISGCSFGFVARSDRWVEDTHPETRAKITVRELLDLDLFDISTVTYPAYDETTVDEDERNRFLFPVAGKLPVEVRSHLRHSAAAVPPNSHPSPPQVPAVDENSILERNAMLNHREMRSRREEVGQEMISLLIDSGVAGKLSPAVRHKFDALSIEARDLTRRLARPERSDREQRYAEAFESYLRNGLYRSTYAPGCTTQQQELLVEVSKEYRDMGTGGEAAYPGAAAGFFAPMEFQGQVTSAMKYIGPMLDVATVIDTKTGAPRAFPVDNDTSISGEQVSEDVQVTDQDVAGLLQVVLNGYKYSSRFVKVSLELLQDAGFDLMEYLAERFGVRLGRVLNSKFTTGSGTNEPAGIVGAVSVGQAAAGSAANDGTGTAANSIGSDDLVNLELSVDPTYRPKASFMMHPNIWATVRSLKDKQGRPIYKQDAMVINGYPVVLNPGMGVFPVSAGTVRTVLFGDFRQYRIRRAPALVLRLGQRFADYGHVAFQMLQRCDGALIDGGGGAVKALTNTL